MPESSTNIESKGKLLQLLLVPFMLKLTQQGFAQMCQDLTKTIAESFELFQSESETQYDYMGEWAEQEETPQATGDDHKVIGEPPMKKKREIPKLQA